MNAAQMQSIAKGQCTSSLVIDAKEQGTEITPEFRKDAKQACELTYQDPSQRTTNFTNGKNAQGMLNALISDRNRTAASKSTQEGESASAAKPAETAETADNGILATLKRWLGV
ncbi:MAG: hypothetical protein K8R69_06755 [Deltaproteobacteria bacterium]|nr:hypothetical protein [Deltaproteobacteria bacterium]